MFIIVGAGATCGCGIETESVRRVIRKCLQREEGRGGKTCSCVIAMPILAKAREVLNQARNVRSVINN
jgi:hypothetical protein